LQRLCGKINRTAVGRLMKLILALGSWIWLTIPHILKYD
jgi:hypothetical protein